VSPRREHAWPAPPRSFSHGDALASEPIHAWFELTYANYLAIPRSVLQSMPVEWQRKFVRLMDELDDTIDWRRDGLTITRRDERGRYIQDDLVDYERGRRRIPHRGTK